MKTVQFVKKHWAMRRNEKLPYPVTIHFIVIVRPNNSRIPKKSDCPICRKKSALEQALTGSKAVDNKHGSSARNKSEKNVCFLLFLVRRSSKNI